MHNLQNFYLDKHNCNSLFVKYSWLNLLILDALIIKKTVNKTLLYIFRQYRTSYVK